MSSFTRLRFGDGLKAEQEGSGVVIAPGPVALHGGWSREQRCNLDEAVCGLQANVEDVGGGKGDSKGIVDLRVYCCDSLVDCASTCAGELSQTVKCLVCKQAA